MDSKPQMTASMPITAAEVKARTKISENFYTVFSNQIRIAASPTEFRLFIGENYASAAGEVKVVENLSIVVTPTQAKALAANLAAIVQKIEAVCGPIPPLMTNFPAALASLVAPTTPTEEPKK